MVTRNIVNELVEFYTYAPTEIYVYKETTNDVQDSLVELSESQHDARWLLSKSRREK